MTTEIKILDANTIKRIETPPIFSSIDRRKYFQINSQIRERLSRLKGTENQIGYLIQLGYFKASNRFYQKSKFHVSEIEYVSKLLGYKVSKIDLKKYNTRTQTNHRGIILSVLNKYSFDANWKRRLQLEIRRLISKTIRPRKMLSHLYNYLLVNQVEYPSYSIILKLITQELNKFEQSMLDTISKTISKETESRLKGLLNKITVVDEDEDNLYKVTVLKKISQSTKPGKIKTSLLGFEEIKQIFLGINQTVAPLKLSPELIRYYAVWVGKARTFQLLQFTDKYKQYLYLIAFISHQYYTRQDAFIDTFIKASNSALSTSKVLHKEYSFQNRKSKNKIIRHLGTAYYATKGLVKSMVTIRKKDTISKGARFDEIAVLLDSYAFEAEEQEEQFDDLIKEVSRSEKDADYYKILEQRSRKLQNRVAGILESVIFNDETSDKDVLTAIQYTFKGNGRIGQKAPVKFLDDKLKEMVFDDDGKIRGSLYKCLVVVFAAEKVKSGELNLKHSYKYLSIDEYLINKKHWEENKPALITQAGLDDFLSYERTMKILKELLDNQWHITNKGISSRQNPFFKFSKKMKPIVTTPAVEKVKSESLSSLFKSCRYVPILKILSDVNKTTGFLKCFDHYTFKNAKRNPSEQVFFAGIISMGCNLGNHRTSRTSKGIDEDELNNVVNWRFNLDTLDLANNAILETITKLELPKIFIRDINELYSSADGQKKNVSVDSLNANYSFKYCGSGKGVSVYTFMDERGLFYYSTVISSSERESAYVIDGLMENDVVKSSIHCVDTHGFSEIVFGVTYLMKIAFAPRIKNFKDMYLYSFGAKKEYTDLGYELLPIYNINETNIKEHWDDILRFVATIKLKESTASQLFKRLSSYSKHNPLYIALKEFGRVSKSIFLLRYMHSLELRQSIEKQLSMIELSQRFSNAVFYANDHEFFFETKEEQQIADSCRRLIQNAIVLWNYLYLSQLLAENPDHRDNLLFLIRNGCIICWEHINMSGEYDFNLRENTAPFNMKKILALSVA